MFSSLLRLLLASAVLLPVCCFAETDPDARIAIVERIAERLEGQLGTFGLQIRAEESEFLKMRPDMAVADGHARYRAEENVMEREIPLLQGQRIEGTLQSEIKQTGTRTLTARTQSVTIFLSDQWTPRESEWKDAPANRTLRDNEHSDLVRTLETRGPWQFGRAREYDTETVHYRKVLSDRAVQLHGFPGRIAEEHEVGRRAEPVNTLETRAVDVDRPISFDGYFVAEQDDFRLGVHVEAKRVTHTWVPAMTEPEFTGLLERIAGIVAEELSGEASIPAPEPEPDSRPEPMPEPEIPEIAAVEVFDANPLYTGGLPVEDIGDPAELLRVLAEKRVGVCADGVSRVVLRVAVDTPGRVALELAGESMGSLAMLRGGRTHQTEEQHYAFAVYTPPGTLPGSENRGAGRDPRIEGAAAYREVPLNVKLDPSDPELEEVVRETGLRLVRPPVVLVHGTFDNPQDCWTTSPPVEDLRHGALSMRQTLQAAGYAPFLVDFSETNGSRSAGDSGFERNRRVLWANPGGIYDALHTYRKGLDVATTQVDVVGHSLGGLIARLWVSEHYNSAGLHATIGFDRNRTAGYRRVDNFQAGDIRRLVTICTPHSGSDLGQFALAFRELPGPLLQRFNFPGLSFSPSDVEQTGVSVLSWFSGYEVTDAVRNQLPHLPGMRNEFLERIGATPVPSHAVVCWARLPDLKDFGGDYELVLRAAAFWLRWVRGDVVREFLSVRGQERELERIYGEVLSLESGSTPDGERSAPEIGAFADELPLGIRDRAVLNSLVRAAIFGNTQNDLVVRVESQIGGLPVKYTTQIGGILHSYAPRYRRVQRAVVSLLDGPDRNFHRSGFPVPPLLQNVEPFEVEQDPATRAEAIAASGYVPSHAEAISRVAMDEDVVILGRPVNRNATALIAAHNATKDMHVKGKSSNWGPQKGYLPVEQRFSKLHFAKKDREAEIDEFDEKVQECLAAGDAKPIPLSVEVGGVRCRVLVVQGIDNPERAVVLEVLESGTFHGWRNGEGGIFDPRKPPAPLEIPLEEIQRLGTNPLEILADSRSGKPLTADYDMLAFATRFQPKKPLNDPEMGGIRPFQIDLIRRINHAVRIRANYIGGDVTHHGPENLFDKSPGPDYPITVFEPSGYIITIPEGRKGRSDYWLKRYFHHLRTRDWIIQPNRAAWRWGEYDPETWPGIGWFPNDRPKPKDTDSHHFDSDEGDEDRPALPLPELATP